MDPVQGATITYISDAKDKTGKPFEPRADKKGVKRASVGISVETAKFGWLPLKGYGVMQRIENGVLVQTGDVQKDYFVIPPSEYNQNTGKNFSHVQDNPSISSVILEAYDAHLKGSSPATEPPAEAG